MALASTIFLSCCRSCNRTDGAYLVTTILEKILLLHWAFGRATNHGDSISDGVGVVFLLCHNFLFISITT